MLCEEYCSLVLRSQLQLLCKLDVAQRVYSEKATEVANLNKQLEEVQVCMTVVGLCL